MGWLTTSVQAWSRFWHWPVRAPRLARAGRLLAMAATLDAGRHLAWLRQARTPTVLQSSFGPLRSLGAGRLGSHALALLWIAVITAGVIAAGVPLKADRTRRAAFGGLALLYAWWSGEHYAYGVPSHATTALVMSLIAFALAPSRGYVSEPAADAQVSGWPLHVTVVSLAFLYLTSTWAKIDLSGFGWWHGGATETGVALWGPGWAQRFTAANPSLVHVGAFVALVGEPLVAVGLLVPRTRRLASVVAVAFHLVVRVFMGIDFLPMAACAGVAGWATDARARHHRVRRAQSVRIVRSPFCVWAGDPGPQQ